MTQASLLTGNETFHEEIARYSTLHLVDCVQETITEKWILLFRILQIICNNYFQKKKKISQGI